MTADSLPENIRALYPFASHVLQTPGGHRMQYLDEGEGEPIVFLHGNPTWSFFYRHLVLGLRGKYRCIVPDHIGCGLSEKPQTGFSYQLKDHIANVVALLEHLKIERFSLVVHDWGGAIGCGVATQMPERVRALQVMNTAAFRSTRIPARIALCRAPLIGELMVRGLNVFAGSATFMAATKKLSPAVKAGFLFPYNNWANRIATHRFVVDIPTQPAHPSYETLVEIENGLERLKHLPMHILWGGRDFCFNDSFYQEWCARFPQAQTHYLPGANHYLLEDAPNETLAHTKAFFAQALE